MPRSWSKGALYGARTDDIEMYRSVFNRPEIQGIRVTVKRIDTPEVQRIRIETNGTSAEVGALNRGGGRVAITDAKPSRSDAVRAAQNLGIELTD